MTRLEKAVRVEHKEEVDGVILSKGRLLQDMEFLKTAKVERSFGPGVSGPDCLCWTDTALSATQLLSMSTGTLVSTEVQRPATELVSSIATSFKDSHCSLSYKMNASDARKSGRDICSS